MRSVLSVSVPPELLEKLDEVAEKVGSPRSQLVREAIRRYVLGVRLSDLRSRLRQSAEKQGVFTDEDVFRKFA
jgi:metal-responsive CopG/Arc/MetJ family transcriptional regulator